MGILKWFKDIFLGLSKAFKKFVEEFAKNLMDREVQAIWEIAKPIVLNLMNSDLSSSEKRKKAIDMTIQTLKADGKSFKDHQINMIIESLVFTFKKEF
jgi:hypothetical protein